MLRLAAIAVSVVALGAPVSFTQPTSIELLPDGKLLLVENNPGRLLKVDPRNGKVTVVVRSMTQPYSVVLAPSGAVYVSVGSTIRKVGSGVVVRSAEQIGPIATGPDGSLYYTTGDAAWHATTKLAGGLSNPHGLALAPDGSVLVSDTDANRIVRIASGVSLFAAITAPRGMDIGKDGTVYVVTGRRVARFAPDGSSRGFLGPRLPGDPYDLQVAPNGTVYVLESGQIGDIRVISPTGRMSVLRRR